MKKQRGMTLLEVMVATAILAVSAGLMTQGVGSALQSVSARKMKVMASWVAQNRLNELLLIEDSVKVGTSRGEAENAGLTWYWEQKVTATETLGVKLRRIEIEVKLNEDSEDSYGYITALIGAS